MRLNGNITPCTAGCPHCHRRKCVFPFSGGFIMNIMFIFNLLLISLSWSQSYLTHTYTEFDGLPSSFVYDVAQDSVGRIWFATRNGITVYDGTNWEVFDKYNSLPVSQFRFVRVDSHGIVWAATEASSSPVWYFDGQEWQSIPAPPESIWVGSRLTSFDITSENGETVIALVSMESGLFLYRNGAWKHFGLRYGVPESGFMAVAGHDGKFYVGTNNGLYQIYNGELERLQSGKLPSDRQNIFALTAEAVQGSMTESNHPHRLWILGREWLGYLENGQLHTVLANMKSFNIPMRFDEPTTLLSDGMGGVYFGNAVELYFVDVESGHVQPVDENNGLVASGATGLLKDRENNIWVTSLRGVSKIVSKRFETYRKRHGLLEDEVASIQELGPGKMMFGHGSGITVMEEDTITYYRFEKDPFENPMWNRIMDMDADEYGNVWIASTESGIIKIDADGNISRFDGINGSIGSIWAINVLKNGDILAGGSKGLFRVNRDHLVTVSTGMAFIPAIRHIVEGPGGEIYLATLRNGIIRYSRGRWSQFLYKDDKKFNSTYNVLHDSKGRIWVGSEKGLLKIREGKLVAVSKNDGPVIDHPVYLLLEDNDGNIWIGTDNGVILWDGEKSRKFTIYSGLGGQQTNRSAGIVDYKGRVWIGTDRGASCYNKKYDRQNPVPPGVEILTPIVSGKSTNFSELRDLTYTQNDIVFPFRVISFSDENRVRIRWKLSGLEDWNTRLKGSNSTISYLHLPPGKYRLALQAINNEGIESDVIVSPEITIHQPYWKQGWFLLIVAVIIIVFLLVLYRYLYNRHYAKHLKREVEEKSEEIRLAESRYREMVSNVPALVYRFQMTRDGTKRIVFVNNEATHLTGYEPEEITSEDFPIFDLVDEQDRPEFEQLIERSFVNVEPANVTLRLVTKTGERKWISAYSIAHRLPDETVVWDGVCMDISRQIEMQNQVQMNEQKYRSIFDRSVAAIFIFDRHKRFQDTNEAGIRLLGYEKEELKTMSIDDVDVDLKAVEQAQRSLLEGKPLENFRHKLRRKNGEVITVLNNSSPLTDETNKVIGIISTLVDITKMVRLQEQEFKRIEHLKKLDQLFITIGQSDRTENIYRAIYEYISHELPVDGFFISLYDRKNNTINAEFVMVGGRQKTEKFQPLKVKEGGNSPQSQVVRTGKYSYFPDNWQEIIRLSQYVYKLTRDKTAVMGQLTEEDVKHSVKSALLVPMRSHEGVIGVIMLQSRQANPYDVEDIHRIQRIADMASLAIYKIRSLEDARRELEERKKVEADLRQVMEFNKNLVEGMSEGISVQDLSGYISYVNKAACDLLGYSKNELIGEHWKKIIPEEFWDKVNEADERRKKRKSDAYEIQLRCKDGTLLDVLVSGSPRFKNGELVSTMAVFTNITELVKAKEEVLKYQENLEKMVQERVRELESFTYSVSHEFEKPLRTIYQYVHVFIDKYENSLNEDAMRILEILTDNANRLQSMRKALLEVHKMSQVSGIITRINMNELVRDIKTYLSKSEEGYDRVEWEIPTLSVIMGDMRKLRVVWRNYLANAIKFSANAPNPRVVISEKIEGNMITYSVTDNGTGFDNAYKERLFNMFSRLHLDSEFPGHGIGLAIVKRIIYSYGGKVDATGEPGKGATFSFTIPLNPRFQEPHSSTEDEAAPPAS